MSPANFTSVKNTRRQAKRTHSMKMTKLETFHIQPRWLFLKIHTDAGIVGWGESVLEGRACTMELTKLITSCCRSVPNSTTLP